MMNSNILRFFVIWLLMTVLSAGEPAAIVWKSSPSVERVGKSDIYFSSNYSVSNDGKTKHYCYFGHKIIEKFENGFSISKIIVLPILIDKGKYSWSEESGWVIVRKGSGEVFLKFKLEVFSP